MELKEFVTETLIAVLEGVSDAINRAETDKLIGRVSPAWNSDGGEKMDWKDYVQPVEFDVAVTATRSNGATGKASINIWTFGKGDIEGSVSAERSTVSRIKFSIPIVPPSQHANRHPK